MFVYIQTSLLRKFRAFSVSHIFTQTSILEGFQNRGLRKSWLLEGCNTFDMPSTADNASLTTTEESSTNCSANCKNCENCEMNLTKSQEVNMDLKEQLAAAQELASRYEKELSGERFYRKDLESKLTALSLEAETKIGKCFETNNSFEERLEILAKKQESDVRVMQFELSSAWSKYKLLEDEMLKLNKRYQKLLGLNREKAEEMRERNIELPQSVDQLQFLTLQLREELIEARAAHEHSVNELSDELVVVREQLRDTERLLDESDVRTNSILSTELRDSSRSLNNTNISGNDILRYQGIIAELECQISIMQKERSRNEIALSECRRKCTTLQQELDTCEAVQKDFVKLSQNLQIQLEKLRLAETEVRWQFDDDIFVCNKCETSFNSKIEKCHCKHCGKIFCQSCLTNKFAAGPNHKQAEVCDVCYTLLNRDSVPFFSKMSSKEDYSTN